MSAQAQMIPVESGLFSSIGFDAETSEFLAQYKTGTLGAYGPTTRSEFENVLNDPESVGKAFNRIIKPTKSYRKVGAVLEATMPTLVDIVLHRVPQERTVELDPAEAAPQLEIAVQQQTADLAATALSLTISTHEANIAGQELIIAIGSMSKQVTDFFLPMKTAAHAAHKAVCDRENQTMRPLLDAKRELSTKLVAFEKQVEEDRRAKQRRLQIEAQAAAEAEAKVEAERLALEDAIELEEAGDTVAAEAVLSNPVPIVPRYVSPPVVASSIIRVAGAVVRETWKARIVNANLVPREWLLIDEAGLNKHAASRKGLALVPGVEFYSESSIHGRSK
jgi:hypothetical protein